MKEGDFVRLDFDAFVKETDQIVDTTHEEVAKEHDVYDDRIKYRPMAVVVGSGQLVKGLDKDLREAELGKEREVEVSAKDAFGERDPKLIDVMPMSKILSLPEFRKGDKYPTEGMEIMINNRLGIINRIFAGRVRVDFNHRWAGRTISYKYTVTSLIEDRQEKLRALIEADFRSPDEFIIEFKDDDMVDIILPDMVKLDTGWAMAKFKLVSDLRSLLDLKTVRFIEEYVKKEEIAEEEPRTEESKEEEKTEESQENAPEEGKSEEEGENTEESDEETPVEGSGESVSEGETGE